MTNTLNWRDDLQSEESLFAAYKVALAIKPPPFNRWVRIFVALASSLGIIITALLLKAESNTYFVGLIKFTSDAMFIASVTISAFLVTGFSVFVTMSDEELLIFLASIKHKDSGMSVFKHMFYNFLKVFLVYVVAIAASLVVGFFVSIRWDNRLLIPDVLITILNAVCLWALIQLTTELVLLLKSFMWNVYSTFVSKLLAADEIRIQRAPQTRPPSASKKSFEERVQSEPATTH